MKKTITLFLSWLASVTTIAAQSNGQISHEDTTLLAPRIAASPYAPVPAACPATPLIRKANAVSSLEKDYITKRKVYADYAMELFLIKTKSKFPKLKKYPTAALLTSGGGLRSMLVGAGVVKSFDGREGLETYSTAGIYQAMSYHAGLSGGGWLLSSIASNNYPTISWLYNNLWSTSLATGPFVPGGNNTVAYAQITADTAAKQAAGFNVSIVDPYGRQVAFEILYGSDGGVSHHLSDITTYSNWTENQLAPFPIITSLGVNQNKGQCYPQDNATQYEFTPYEFGSWGKGIKAFIQTKYLGSSLSAGKPTLNTSKACISGFDEQSFVLGTSSDIYPALSCPQNGSTSFSPNMSTAAPISLLPPQDFGEHDEVFALIPNPFYKLHSSPAVANQKQLTLADGGLGNQNNPIWPFLYRPSVSVLIVNDNSADSSQNYPTGIELYTTYQQAVAVGLGARMPTIPPSAVFVAKNLTTRPTVFGCNSTSAKQLTILFLPNTGYNGFNSGTSTFMLEYSAEQSLGMIDDGALVGSFGQKEGWDTCVGCFLVKKESAAEGVELPSACQSCFDEFCYN